MPNEQPLSTARTEAFSDGVIAVIITIMVLELKVPHETGMAGLRALVPILLIYLLSFTFVGIYWLNHHYLLDRVDHANNLILYGNLLFLFLLSLIPFATSYVIEQEITSFAVSIYALAMIGAGSGFLLLRLAIHRSLSRAQDLQRHDRNTRNKHLLSLLVYLAAIPLAHFQPHLALGFIAAITIVWILPTLGLRGNKAS